MRRFDERDTIFSRMELTPGSARFEEYYRRRPEFKETDTAFRNAPPGVFAGREIEQRRVDADFRLIERLRALIDGEPAAEKIEAEPEALTRELIECAEAEGAVAAGIVATPQEFAYGTRGRGELYGKAAAPLLPWTLVYAMEMDYRATMEAPAPEEAVEVAAVYLRLALLGLKLAHRIREYGYRALTHMDGRSQLILPPTAEAAGLGAIGRHGLLVHPRYGSRIRLGAVTTELPLSPTKAGGFGITEFCERCGRCAELCPMGAIPTGNRAEQPDGRWKSDHEACFAGWRRFGTDCGVCLAVCPYSTPAGEAGPARPGSPDFLKRYLFGRPSSGAGD